ncbi:MAG: PKD domain-containing protein [Thermoplasmata archaeon]
MVITLIVSVFPGFSYASSEKTDGVVTENIPIMPDNNDKNNNKLQDNLDVCLKTMSATDNIDVLFVLASKDEGFIKIAGDYDAKVEQIFTIIDAVWLKMPVENITKLAAYPAVDMVYKNESMESSLDESVPLQFGDKATLRNAGFDVDGSGITIAVTDTGIDPNTPSLQTLPDGKTPKIIGWKDCVGSGTQPYADHWHGTYVSSIAAGVARGSWYAGVAPGAQLVGVKTADSSGSSSSFPMLTGLQWILDHKDDFGGIDIVSMSMGVPYTQATRLDGRHEMDMAAKALVSQGIVFVAAAGNDGPTSGSINPPATSDEVIGVGCVNKKNSVWSGSGRGPTADGRIKPDLVAIGEEIYVSSSTFYITGTSAACPHVSGAIALLLEYHNKQLDKYNSATAKSAMKLMPATIKDILIKSASQPSSSGPYPNNNYGNGVLNVKNALAVLKNKNYPPTAKFVTNGALSTGMPITFDASSSIDPNGDSLTYSWDFGDGTTGKGKTTTHAYASAKDYTATLVVKDSKNNANDFGASASLVSQLTSTKKTLTIMTGNKLPVISVMVGGANINKGYVLNFSKNERIDLDASKSSDPDGQVATVSWNMGDGSTAKTGKTLSYSYAADGNYSVVVKATDDKGGDTQFGFTIAIANKLPIAGVKAGDTDVNKNDVLKFSINENITFDASNSTDLDGTIASISWNMGDGSAVETGQNVIHHAYSSEGSYPVIVKLTDDQGGENAFPFTIDIGNGPPVADIRVDSKSVSNDDTVKGITSNKNISFDASRSYDREGSVQSIMWEMGDGTQKSGQTVTHAYTNLSTYDVVVKLTDDVGAMRTVRFKIEIGNSLPVINATTTKFVNVTNATKAIIFQFKAPSSYDPNGKIVSYLWDFGDGVTSDEQNATHKYEHSGTYNITYTVTDDTGATTSVSETVKVPKLSPVANGGGYDVKVSINEDVFFDASRSYSPDGALVKFVWKIDGVEYPSMIVPYRFNVKKKYTVGLVVTDDEGLTANDTVTVNVVNMRPVANIHATAPSLNVGDSVELSAASSYDTDGVVERYVWDFGDGKTDSGKMVTHTYAKSGTFNVALTVWDNDKEQTKTSFALIVKGPSDLTIWYMLIGGICGAVLIGFAVITYRKKRGKIKELITVRCSNCSTLKEVDVSKYKERPIVITCENCGKKGIIP